MIQKNILEICAGDIDSVIAAAKGGAERVELCSALSDGGITPSIGFIKQALKVDGLKVHVLIRPRGGDFLYTKEEIAMMIDDIATCHELGVHGVVIGALTADGDIDFEACKRMVEVAGNMNITFHRAFDLCKDPIKSIDQIIELGCNRLLTSGQAASAEAGVELLHKLVEYANGRIVILAGGGVTPTNAAKILQQSGTNEIHASARSTVQSNMKYRLDGVSMGAADVDEYSRKTTDVKIVTQIKRAIS
jgi:copper homeostasis protein